MIHLLRPAALTRRPALAAMAMLAAALFAAAAVVAPAGADTYTVQNGDTLSGIAERLGFEYGELLRANGGLASPDDIQPGQVIQLPATQAAAPASGGATYTVQDGDTLSGIAERHDTTVERLQGLNPSLDPNRLSIGQVVAVRGAVARPAAAAPAAAAEPDESAPVQVFRYTVQPGDTATGIAVEFDTSLSAIRTRNPGLNLDVISIGETILVPRPALGVAVRPGDTMFDIGLRFGIDLDSMVELNAHLDPENLQPGDVVYIPHAASSPATIAPARTAAAPTAPAEPRVHVVAARETLSGIAARYDLTLLQLRALNSDLDGDHIDIGQRLVVSRTDGAAATPTPTPPRTYVVVADDVLGRIAARHNLTLEQLRALNPQLVGDFINVGDRLIVSAGSTPGTTVASVPTHIVASGDTLYAIAGRHGLTVDQIRALNPGIQGDALSVGTEIRLALAVNSQPEIATDAVTGGVSRRTVAESDLVQYVAAELSTLPQTLLDNNPSLRPDQWIPRGTELIVPATPGKLITVAARDTLYGLAERHGVDVGDITHINGARLDGEVIVPGQQLLVPIPIPVFHWPIDGGEDSDGFGICRTWDCSWRHRGLDVADDAGTAIYAPADGIVTFAGGNPGTGLGYYVQIQHQHGFSSVLAHLSQWNVRLGQQVRRGEIVGLLGNTGNSTGPHLHFEIKHYDWYVDPEILLPLR